MLTTSSQATKTLEKLLSWVSLSNEKVGLLQQPLGVLLLAPTPQLIPDLFLVSQRPSIQLGRGAQHTRNRLFPRSVLSLREFEML